MRFKNNTLLTFLAFLLSILGLIGPGFWDIKSPNPVKYENDHLTRATFGLRFNVQKPMYFADWSSDGSKSLETTSDVSRDPHVISYEGDAGSGSQPVTIRVDSVQDASASLTHDKRNGTWVMFYARAGSQSASNSFGGHIGEMIYAEAEFSSSDRDIVEDSMLNWFSIS